ncbi:hypothetical protein NDU88_000087 [Pleurodeles waltl]|uniref:Uncharacterized protein n=1 Tax=Pleurodeles waltl TaxID=8319 RepID=A0AAV7S769_PLEWA|nr:hypothetical protein NDU88_000087 [Pleurodeles waltl]
MLKTSRQKVGGHKPVGPGIGTQPQCLALPLSTAEKRFRGAVGAKPALLQRQRHRARGSDGGALLTSQTPEKGPGLGKASRRKIGGQEPVGLGIGPQPRCIALPLSAAEQCFRGAVEAKTSPTAETEVSAACTSARDAQCDPAEERRMRIGESHS